MKIKICIWMNIPSHHQSAFFEALHQREDVDLQVRYFMLQLPERIKQGWKSPQLRCYEQCVEGLDTVQQKLGTLPDWKERIHICAYSMCPELVKYLLTNHVKWCHWSETPGVRLMEKLKYNLFLFHLLFPLFLFLKRVDIFTYSRAYRVFAQGKMAHQSFASMGIPDHLIHDLFYASAALQPAEVSENIKNFISGRTALFTVAQICKRKGIDILLRAFASLKERKKCCLIICGINKMGNYIFDEIQRFGLQKQVLFTGQLPYKEVSSVMTAGDIFVLASRFDGWGVVLNEAASLGKPLIASEGVGAAWHLIREGENGFRFKNGDWKDLSEKMAFYLKNPAEIRKHGEKSRDLFFDEFTPEKNAERLVKALETRT